MCSDVCFKKEGVVFAAIDGPAWRCLFLWSGCLLNVAAWPLCVDVGLQFLLVGVDLVV